VSHFYWAVVLACVALVAGTAWGRPEPPARRPEDRPIMPLPPPKGPAVARVDGVLMGCNDSAGGPAAVLRKDGVDRHLVFPDLAAERQALTLRGRRVMAEGVAGIRGERPWFYVFSLKAVAD
jgi:hypothetical protein